MRTQSSRTLLVFSLLPCWKCPANFCLETTGYLLHRWIPEQGAITHQGVVD
ncbi:hypothetical protein [Erwinia sp.]|uniref:hypothetical protein n=1 Tax=Erwinia citreus TaxID=558 RepID=UPI003C740B80